VVAHFHHGGVPERRSQGIGAALLAEAKRQAIARGCKYAYVDTMEFQAPRFYLAHGFAKVGEIPDWDSHRSSQILFLETTAMSRRSSSSLSKNAAASPVYWEP